MSPDNDIRRDPDDDGDDLVRVELAPADLTELPDYELRDLHEIDAELERLLSRDPTEARAVARASARAPRPDVVKALRVSKTHTSRVYSYRPGRPNGGTVSLRACVHHIPVIRNRVGRGDLDLLWDVLVAQGLMVQFGSDAEGNVAMYTQANRLCYHARGINSSACGIEHMHYSDEPWTTRQMNAAAWITQYLEREYDIPMQMADVDPAGPGLAKIVRKGHTSHRQISRMAGYHDRNDPPANFDYEEMFARAKFFKRKGHFVGA